MHRMKRRTKTPWLLFFLTPPWLMLCLLTGSALATMPDPVLPVLLTDRQPAPATASAVPTIAPQPTKLPLSASYGGYGTGLRLRGKQPKVLIYHTHTTEAYFPTEDAPYQQTSAWRTNDNSNNVVAVGERLKEILERDYGFAVLHDTTDHEPPKLSTAYERSEQTMLSYAEQYPSIEVFIDLHRDAYGSEPTEPTDTVLINGREVARLMFVVGRGEDYEDKPFFETNRRFAERITEYLTGIDPKLARPIREKKGRYNQHVGAYCLLVEVGHNANTLEQAMAAVPFLAEGIAYAVAATEHTVQTWLPE